MKIARNTFKLIYTWCLGISVELFADNPEIIGRPKYIFYLQIDLLRWEYYLEIHLGGAE